MYHTKLMDAGIVGITKVVSVSSSDDSKAHEVHIKMVSFDILIGFVIEATNDLGELPVEFIENLITSEEDTINKLTEQEFAAYLAELLAPNISKLYHYDIVKPKQGLKLIDSTLDSSESIMYRKFTNMLEIMGLL